MASRWKRYYQREMENPESRELVESNLKLNAYHIELIKKGIRAAEQGKLVSHAEMKTLIAKMQRSKRKARKKSSSGNVQKALKILARAGKKNPPVPGDELPGGLRIGGNRHRRGR